LCAINSRQVEALCRFAPLPKMPSEKPSFLQAEGPVLLPPGPSLNYDDLPEAGFGSRPKFACRQGRKRAPQARAKASVTCFKPVPEEEQWSDDRESTFEPEEEVAWPCPSCTFLNIGSARECEMCSQTAPDQSEPLDGPAVSGQQVPTGKRAWPSLVQAVNPAWDACDQSSVAAGDIGELTEARIAELSNLPGQHVAAQQFGNASQAGEDVSVAGSWLKMEDNAVEEFAVASELGDNASVAASWLCVEYAETASMASWLDVAPVAEVEPMASKPSWASLAATPAPAAKPSRQGVRVPPLAAARRRVKKVAVEEEEDWMDGQDRRNKSGSRAHRRCK